MRDILCENCTAEEAFWKIDSPDKYELEYVESKAAVRLLGFGHVRKAIEDKMREKFDAWYPMFYQDKWYIGRDKK